MSAFARREHQAAAPTAAWLLASLVTVGCVAAFALAAGAHGGWRPDLLDSPEATVGPVVAIAGATLVSRAAAGGGRRVGWWLLGMGLSAGVYALSISYAGFAFTRDRTPGGLAQTAAWVSNWSWLPAFAVAAVVLPQVFPDGRPLGRAGRRILSASYAVVALGVLVLAATPGPLDSFPRVANPVGVRALSDALKVALVVDGLLMLGLFLAGATVMAMRFRQADAAGRRQVGWVWLAVVLAVVGALLGPWWVNDVTAALVPISIAVAVLRYRLYDLDIVLNRALVGGALVAVSALVYFVVVGWAAAVLGDNRGASFLAAIAVAMAFHPARVRVQRAVDRLLYGEGGEPLRLLTRVEAELRESPSPRQALRDVVETLGSALKLPGLAVEVVTGDSVVRESHGRVDAGAGAVDLVWNGERVGRLLATPRVGAGALSPRDEEVLAALAGPVSAVGYAMRLVADLEVSREHLLTAREEERRRMRRDLHDGVGPQMASVVMRLDTAAAALKRGDLDKAVTLVAAAEETATQAVDDVRRLVHGLRPPALDDLGLVGALRASSLTLAAAEAGSHDGGAPVRGSHPSITVEATGDVDDLPAAVEVAAFRIAQEALTNVVRHARAASARVQLRATGTDLELEVVDDGIGLDDRRAGGLGLSSMRERAAELGGTCIVAPLVTGGTRVLVRLPIRAVPAPRGPV